MTCTEITRLTLVTLLFAAVCAAAELVAVDEVLAVVGRTPILRSDLELASLVGFADTLDDGLSVEERTSRLLDARIRLELQFYDLAASGAVQRLDIDVPGRMEAMVAYATDEESLREALADKGLAWDDVEALALRIEAARAWVEERLRPRITVTLKDLESAYERLIAAPLQERGESVPPMTQVHEQLRVVVEEEKLNFEIDRWLARCREQHPVVRYVP